MTVRSGKSHALRARVGKSFGAATCPPRRETVKQMAIHREVIVRRASIAVPILALALSLACGHDSSTDPNNASLGGVYSLSTVNGSALPFTVANGTTSVTLISDVLTVTDAGGWSEAFAIRVTQNGTSTNQ